MGQIIQDAQLSQRDRTAGCVTVFAKSRRRSYHRELGGRLLLEHSAKNIFAHFLFDTVFGFSQNTTFKFTT